MHLYVSFLTNLTDARFFSASGVQYFGFCFDVLDDNAITIDKAREIVGWLHEPKVIGQFGDHQTWEEMQFVDSQLPLYGVQITVDHPERNKILVPKWIVTENGIIEEATSGLFISGDWTRELLAQAVLQHPYGIHISCTKEEKPGLSNVDHYAELIEILEPYLE